MTEFRDPKAWVTVALIGLFAWAFGENPQDEQMRGALIAAFAAAYGYWLGNNASQSKATDNTGEAFRAIMAAAAARPPETPAGTPTDPIATKEVP